MSDQPALPLPAGLAAFRSPILKVVAIVGLVLAFLIPLALVHDTIMEREGRRAGAVAEIGKSWGRAQRVFGPVLAISYQEALTSTDIEFKRPPTVREAHLLPDRYVVDSRIDPELRRRGLFEAAVYRTKLDVSGDFIIPDPATWAPQGATILWESRARADRRTRPAQPVRRPRPALERREHAVLRAQREHERPQRVGCPDEGGRRPALEFALALKLKGSDTLSFLPLGRDTHVTASSSWPDPSFVGSHLPDQRTVSPKGFDAAWTVSYFARDYPQIVASGAGINSFTQAIDKSEFGIRLASAVTAYQQAERAVKYGLLIIVGTFTTFFLFEILRGLRIHIFQYGLVGLSLCVFYLLLVSLSEQIGFGAAYLIAASAVIVQIVLYCHHALGGIRGTALLGSLLVATYGALYQLMLLEDQALLMGSIGLFAALSAIMLVTRRIDWYALRNRPVPAEG